MFHMQDCCRVAVCDISKNAIVLPHFSGILGGSDNCNHKFESLTPYGLHRPLWLKVSLPCTILVTTLSTLLRVSIKELLRLLFAPSSQINKNVQQNFLSFWLLQV